MPETWRLMYKLHSDTLGFFTDLFECESKMRDTPKCWYIIITLTCITLSHLDFSVNASWHLGFVTLSHFGAAQACVNNID